VILNFRLPLAAFVACMICFRSRALPPLGQEAYVWQRAWNNSVVRAVTNHGSAFTNLIVLEAEVAWNKINPELMRAHVDYAALKATRRPIGIALRVDAYSGSFSADDQTTRFLCDVALALINEACTNGIQPDELQIDFDCAASKLDGYRVWLKSIQRKISPTRLTITVLPSWLAEPSFELLAKATDGYVLQVHSLEKPKDINSPFSLCDPERARRAVEDAGKVGVPFDVALPTYGYLLAFRSGQLLGLSAEGPSKSWPADTQIREVRADPLQMAGLVRFWTTNRPPAMQAIIWYRLPVAVDNLNWRWPTLGAIVASRLPRENLRSEARRIETGLVDINLANDGELDLSSRLVVEVRWSRERGARLVAADGLHGFSMLQAGTSLIRFQNDSQPGRLAAGEEQTIGWLRFDRDCEVQIELKKM